MVMGYVDVGMCVRGDTNKPHTLTQLYLQQAQAHIKSHGMYEYGCMCVFVSCVLCLYCLIFATVVVNK